MPRIRFEIESLKLSEVEIKFLEKEDLVVIWKLKKLFPMVIERVPVNLTLESWSSRSGLPEEVLLSLLRNGGLPADDPYSDRIKAAYATASCGEEVAKSVIETKW